MILMTNKHDGTRSRSPGVDSAEAAATLQWYKAENKRIGWLWWDIGLGIFVAIPMLAVGTIFMATDEDKLDNNTEDSIAQDGQTPRAVEEGNVANNSGDRAGAEPVPNVSTPLEAEGQTKESVRGEPDAEKARCCQAVVKFKDACCLKYAPKVIRSRWFKYTAWLVSGVAISGGLYYFAHGLGSTSVYSAGCDSKQPDISSSMYV